ncbi:UNVERIFIED_CONTAM: hypothetical protein Scaly_1153700 [Sesamum calycinum]|uniref:Uncharacterized protein n=1 Tax=Sesamum calycinum TaxID=2727403 RepID=A0AAW2Q2A4_9LAMI
MYSSPPPMVTPTQVQKSFVDAVNSNSGSSSFPKILKDMDESQQQNEIDTFDQIMKRALNGIHTINQLDLGLGRPVRLLVCTGRLVPSAGDAPGLNWPGRASGAVTLKKLECSKQAYALYTLAWDNIIGFRSYYVGLRDRTFAKDVFINQERKLGARRRSDTVLVSTINDADQGSADVALGLRRHLMRNQSLWVPGEYGSKMKLKEIDRSPVLGVEPTT